MSNLREPYPIIRDMGSLLEHFLSPQLQDDASLIETGT
ncbi:hypothetical protein BN59_00664 [Legionella massiliensis]|uniref:Uncharacterized protein n=1 Tax=Legionella massiliensis TaxID=1034943 RepID=A0A078KPR8_9GAMM|nr:hypothetical protein BN59_00664 [Legionella massiliensis]CEE12133.1 hypothetical protein BN1094_00664 [Legionella massiliensis]